MAFEKSFLFVLAYLCIVQTVKPATSTEKAEQVQTDNTCDGFGYEILLSKIEYLEYKLVQQNEQIMRNQEQTQSDMTRMLTWMEQALGQNFTLMMNQSLEILQQQKNCSNHENLEREISNLKPTETSKGPFESCKSEPSKISGKYVLQPFGEDMQFVGYCEQSKYGGGWLVIQQRFDGSVDFFRNWTEYERGFGEPDEEYWMGLELMHKLTKDKTHHLMVELKDNDETYKYAMFDGFEIGSEAEKYSLKVLGIYNGTAGDSLTYHKGMSFSTYDNDNDAYNEVNCARDNSGAWWYKYCYSSNLNGEFFSENISKSVSWYGSRRLKYTRMMIREA